MREREIEKQFREAVKQAGGTAYKFVSPGNDGVPDRLVVMPGNRIGFVEVKAPGKRPTPLQQARIRRLRELGCCVLILDDPAEIPQVVAEICRGQAISRPEEGEP